MDNRLFLLLHVTSVILLSGVTFAAFAAPQSENRRPSLVLSGLTGMAFRMTGRIPTLRIVAVVVIAIAVAMVIYKPF